MSAPPASAFQAELATGTPVSSAREASVGMGDQHEEHHRLQG
jgi:hypothetical protein